MSVRPPAALRGGGGGGGGGPPGRPGGGGGGGGRRGGPAGGGGGGDPGLLRSRLIRIRVGLLEPSDGTEGVVDVIGTSAPADGVSTSTITIPNKKDLQYN